MKEKQIKKLRKNVNRAMDLVDKLDIKAVSI